MAVIALHGAVRLAEMLARWLDVEVPGDVRGVAAPVKFLRDALEHIDERAKGMVKRQIDPAALDIFDQGDFIENGRPDLRRTRAGHRNGPDRGAAGVPSADHVRGEG